MAESPDSPTPDSDLPTSAGAPDTARSLRAPAPGSFTPRVRPVSVPGETAPAGASFTPPTPAPLPDRGAALFLFITLVAALLAVTFTVLIALKL